MGRVRHHGQVKPHSLVPAPQISVPGELANSQAPVSRFRRRLADAAGVGVALGALLAFTIPLWATYIHERGQLLVLAGSLLAMLLLSTSGTWIPQLTGVRGRDRFLDSRLTIHEAWTREVELRGRPGLLVVTRFLPRGITDEDLLPAGRSVDLEVRLQGRNHRYVTTGLPGYRGPEGEALARARSGAFRNPQEDSACLGVFLPLRALDLPAGSRFEGVAVLRFRMGDVDLADHELSLVLVVPQPTVLAPAEATLVLPEDTSCGVCGDRLTGELVTCACCETHHHRDCWEYLHGCATFGCEGTPRSLSA